jgi:hypothetical protein
MTTTAPSPWTRARVELGTYSSLDDDEPHVFIQWKGTDVCFDFWCECGRPSHFDGYFAYQFRCGCGLIWAMPFTVYPVKVTEGQLDCAGPVDLEMDDA